MGRGPKKPQLEQIRMGELSEKSTPCEICVAMTGRWVERNKDGLYWVRSYCVEIIKPQGVNGIGGSGCVDAHKALIKLAYLTYLGNKQGDRR